MIILPRQMKKVDLNCDMGEGCGNDAELMKLISSANIACGFHAGDPTIMRETAEAALRHGVSIGAHPGYPDKENFGRNAMDLPARAVFDLIVYQVSALKGICMAIGADLRHVKPHGALYNQAAADPELAAAIADAVKAVDERLLLFGLAGSVSISQAESVGLKAVSEVFADRTYQPDGNLTPRSRPDALIRSTEIAVEQAINLVATGTVRSIDGPTVAVRADTICIHGDGEHAVAYTRAIREALTSSGVRIAAPE